MIDLLPFQKRFLRGAFAPGIDTAVLSVARGNGKTTLAAYILERCLTPGDPWHVPGAEYILGAQTLEAAGLCFRPIRQALEPLGGYSFTDNATRKRIVHRATGTALRVVASNGKGAMGIVGCPVAVLDESGSWEVNGGQLMHDAIQGALGKPDSPMRAIYIGTLAPAVSGWWPELIKGGSDGSTYVQALVADVEKWDKASEIRRVNPLKWRYPDSRRKLLEARDAAYSDTRQKSFFVSYFMNFPAPNEGRVLLTLDDWKLALARPVGSRAGKPLVGADMGQGRAFSSAVAIWKSGAVAALAICPGVPDVPELERRDKVGKGTYQSLIDAGLLRVAQGQRVPTPAQLMDAITGEWGTPTTIIADRFKAPELADAAGRVPVEPRRMMPSDAENDIDSLSRYCKDGPLSVDPASAPLIETSIAVTTVATDGYGNRRIVKSPNNTARDDVCAALALAAGGHARRSRVKTGGGYLGK